MTEAVKNCEYFLVHYVPTVLRETRVAVGLFLFGESGRLVGHRITADWRWVRCLNPQADMGVLEGLSAHFARLVAGSPGTAGAAPQETLYARLQQMEQEYAGALQISSPRGVQTADPQQEFERLFRAYVEPLRTPRAPATRREGSRSWIRAALAAALERHGLLQRVEKDIAVEEYTAPGDRFHIDYGYRPNGVMKYFHALSLERDWTQAKLLSYTFWRIRETAAAELTAVVADADPALPAVQSCRQILTGAQISLQPLSQLDPFLETVRRELPSP